MCCLSSSLCQRRGNGCGGFALASDPRQNYFGRIRTPAAFNAITVNMPKFVPRQRKHKVLARRKPSNDGATIDANAAEILPQEEQERAQKKAALKDELTRESQGKMSGKKKKRLDKYIVRAASVARGLARAGLCD